MFFLGRKETSCSISQINRDPSKHEHLESMLTSGVVMWNQYHFLREKIQNHKSLSIKYSHLYGFEWPSSYEVHMPGQGTSPSLFPDSQVQISRPKAPAHHCFCPDSQVQSSRPILNPYEHNDSKSMSSGTGWLGHSSFTFTVRAYNQ
jgi:hypothetical protein